ncbi:MAG: hypothetical protein K2Y16_15770 [Burkholderiales bacterium]|nr:hypothetical protein [Burkholderiales bacterium]
MSGKTFYSILAAGVLFSAHGVSAMEKHAAFEFTAIPLGAEELREAASPNVSIDPAQADGRSFTQRHPPAHR